MKFGEKNYVGLIKFGAKQHMDALYNEGLLYLNTFSYFKNLEHSGDGRADCFEGTTEYYSGEEFDKMNVTLIIGNKSYTLSRKGGTLGIGITDTPPQYSHLYSMTSIDINWALKNNLLLDERNFAKNKDYVVMIHNPASFLERLQKCLTMRKYTCKSGFIEYIDPDNYSGDIGCFRKFNSYSYQNEWRLALSCYDTQEPLKIYLGSLSDIAIPPMDKTSYFNLKFRIGDKSINTRTNICD